MTFEQLHHDKPEFNNPKCREDSMGSRLKIVALMFGLIIGASLELRAQIITPNRPSGGRREFVPGRFIVTLRDDADPAAVVREHGVQPQFMYTRVMKGFAGQMSEAARSGLLRDGRVRRIEQDAVVTADQVSWGLDRIDQRQLPLNGTYTRNYRGNGVTVYIVDTGIRFDHIEFGGRASFGYDAFGGDGNDCNGHGTHVAGTAGGTNYGVASNVSLVAVRVLDCSGSGYTSGVIAGLDWIAANRRSPSVVNMSLGGPVVAALDDAVVRLTNAGTAVVVAAGNENVDACGGSPSRVPDAITVGATDQSDIRASFSNYGSCVDFFAPGVSIPSAYYTGSTVYAYMSGTSMATPHVAGAAALLLEHYPSITARALRDSLYNHTTKGLVTSALSANNHLLYSLETNDPSGSPTPPPPAPNSPPSVSFTTSCGSLACSFSDRSTDVDGSIVAWQWNFGTGATSTLQNPSYTFPAAGTYTVTLTVTDNAGATGTGSGSVTVTAPATQGITLTATGYKVKGYPRVDLRWSGATSSTVDIWRNNVKIATVANSGAYTNSINSKGSGTYTYRVCNAGTSTCSGNAAVTF
jgi:subtilisin family serine protease